MLNKYKGLIFTDDKPPNKSYTIPEEKMYRQPFRAGGWCVLGELAKYDGTDYDVLQPF